MNGIAAYERFVSRMAEHFYGVQRVPWFVGIEVPISWFEALEQIAIIEGRDAWDVKQ